MKITLDRERNLKLNMNTMRLFEEKSGSSLFKLDENFTALQLQSLLFACLAHEDPELTFEQVGDMIDLHNMAYVSECIAGMMNTDKKKA